MFLIGAMLNIEFHSSFLEDVVSNSTNGSGIYKKKNSVHPGFVPLPKLNMYNTDTDTKYTLLVGPAQNVQIRYTQFQWGSTQ